MAIPLFETCGIASNDITADALLTQRAIANHVVEQGRIIFYGQGHSADAGTRYCPAV